MYICFLFSKYPLSARSARIAPKRAFCCPSLFPCVFTRRFLEQRVAVGKLLANTKATKPTMAPLPLVNSASGLNGPKVLPGAVTPSGLDFFNTGANEAAKMTTAQNGAKNKPAPGYVTVSETPSANVNVLVENTCPHKDLFWVISVYKAAIQPICATRPLIISIAVGFVNTFMASSELRVVPERRGFGDGTIRGVAVL